MSAFDISDTSAMSAASDISGTSGMAESSGEHSGVDLGQDEPSEPSGRSAPNPKPQAATGRRGRGGLKALQQQVGDVQKRLARTRTTNAALRQLLRDSGIAVPPELDDFGGEDELPGSAAAPPQDVVHFNPNLPYEPSSNESPFVMRLLMSANAADGTPTGGDAVLGPYRKTATNFPHTVEVYPRTHDVACAHVNMRQHITLQFALFDRTKPDELRVSERELLEGNGPAIPFKLSLIYDDTGECVTLDTLKHGDAMVATTDPPLANVNSPAVYMHGGIVTFHLNKVLAMSGATQPMHRRFRFKCKCTHPQLAHLKHLTALSIPFYSKAKSITKTSASRGLGRGRGHGA